MHMAAEVQAPQAPRIFPFMQPNPCSPCKEYAELRDSEPVVRVTLPTGHGAWLVTRHDDVCRVLEDPRFSREALMAPDAPPLLPLPPGGKSLFFMDPPQHTRLRQLASQAFAPGRVERLRPRVEQITEELLDVLAAAGPPADLMAQVVQPLPIRVLCTLLGVPSEDVAQFSEWVHVMLSFGASPPEQMMAAVSQVNPYLTGLIASQRNDPTDTVLSDLLGARDGDDQLNDEELFGFIYDLLGAGYQPVTAEIVHVLLAVLREPERLDLLRDQPELVSTAVEELLRHSQSAGGGLGSVRLATEDVEVGGVMIRAGEPVIPSLNAANLDKAVFTDAEQVDFTRTPNPHLAFGYGIHHCVGAHIGRIELQTLLAALASRFSKLRLATPEQELVWSPLPVFRTPLLLPVEW
jgi:cytochrome P450